MKELNPELVQIPAVDDSTTLKLQGGRVREMQVCFGGPNN